MFITDGIAELGVAWWLNNLSGNSHLADLQDSNSLGKLSIYGTDNYSVSCCEKISWSEQQWRHFVILLPTESILIYVYTEAEISCWWIFRQWLHAEMIYMKTFGAASDENAVKMKTSPFSAKVYFNSIPKLHLANES